MSKPVDVAVAILVRSDGAVLLARRPRGKAYAGYWEFPGGKVEPDEEIIDALRRELLEELGVHIERAYPWITRTFVYPHAEVRLHFHRVLAWRGDPRALEHDALGWRPPDSVDLDPLLPANGPILRGLALPAEYAISQAGELGVERFMSKLEGRLRGGLKLVQLREKELARETLRELARRVVVLARSHGAKVLINADADLAREAGADGVHLTAEQLRRVGARPELAWCGASCHSPEELRLAESLGVDFAVLGPVRATPSHPGSEPLGWERFRLALADSGIPVYALGGIVPQDLEQAWSCGAHGIAMVRGAWRS